MARGGFDGRTVLLLESRRATELATLVSGFGGRPIVAPSLREVPVEPHTGALQFVRDVIADRFDLVVFLTGAGARLILSLVDAHGLRADVAAALHRTKVLSRGPKPMPVLRELGVDVWAIAPEPNTWRDIVATLDGRREQLSLAGARVAVQEYGSESRELTEALQARGATVSNVLVYQWALPDDLEPLRRAVTDICADRVDVLLVTSGIQLVHLWQVARDLGRDDAMHRALQTRVVLASIGPVVSETMARHGLTPDIEASPPRMGILVTRAAEQAAALEAAKRDRQSGT